MKKIILAIIITAGLASCNNFGKKIKVEGTNCEVYYKGDGVTESDAKKTGDFIKTNMITDSRKASIQLTKEADTYTIRFVYDKKVLDTLKNADQLFKYIGAKASKEVFGGKKVNIALADESFKDYKTIAYDEATAKQLDQPDAPAVDLSSYDHDSEGGVRFFWKGISNDESKAIADYIVKNGAFAGGTAEIFMTKEGDRYILKFPMKESARNDASYMTEVDKVSKEIKDNAFANVPYSFIVTDEQLVTVKSWDY